MNFNSKIKKLTPWFIKLCSPCISVTMHFQHIVLMSFLLYSERPFKWCSWLSKLWTFFLVNVDAVHITSPVPGSYQLLIFVNLYQHAKNQFIPSVHSSDAVNFRVPPNDCPHLFLTMLTLAIFDHFLICMNLCQHAKNQLIPSVHYWDIINTYSFLSPDTRDWAKPFLTMPNQKIFNKF